MGLTDELRKTIEKNLPAEVSSSLQHRLALADRLENEVADLKARNSSLQERADETAKLNKRRSELMDAAAKLSAREDELEHEHQLIQHREACANDRREDTWKMLELLLGNRVVRQRVQRQVPVDIGSTQVTEYRGGDQRTVAVPAGEGLQDANETTETEEA